jgi:hypothetical protein
MPAQPLTTNGMPAPQQLHCCTPGAAELRCRCQQLRSPHLVHWHVGHSMHACCHYHKVGCHNLQDSSSSSTATEVQTSPDTRCELAASTNAMSVYMQYRTSPVLLLCCRKLSTISCVLAAACRCACADPDAICCMLCWSLHALLLQAVLAAPETGHWLCPGR